jgi:hypothetical protein
MMPVRTLIQSLVLELESGPAPSNEDIKDLCHALHASMVRNDVPSLLWLSVSFEDMGDLMYKAMKCIVHDEQDREEDLLDTVDSFRKGAAF